MAAILEVAGIVTRFGTQTVHAGLDMQVQQGEVFGVIGGSGAGKSVLLRTICSSSARRSCTRSKPAMA